jgi:hypothetical protein
MGLFDGLRKLLGGGAGERGDGDAYFLYVRCGACGEAIRVRAHRRWDFHQEFSEDSDGVVGYTLHKEIMGQRCFRIVRATVRFDARLREVERAIEGGEFISEQEWQAAQASA